MEATDLLHVGPEKLLGYLPIRTIESLCGWDVDDIVEVLREKGLCVQRFSMDECDVWSGAVYVYDSAALGALLTKNAKTLVENDWPTQVDEFVKYHVTHDAPHGSDLFDLIANAYADYTNCFRKTEEAR